MFNMEMFTHFTKNYLTDVLSQLLTLGLVLKTGQVRKCPVRRGAVYETTIFTEGSGDRIVGDRRLFRKSSSILTYPHTQSLKRS